MATEHLEGHPIRSLGILSGVDGRDPGLAAHIVFGMDGREIIFPAEAVAASGHGACSSMGARSE